MTACRLHIISSTIRLLPEGYVQIAVCFNRILLVKSNTILLDLGNLFLYEPTLRSPKLNALEPLHVFLKNQVFDL